MIATRATSILEDAEILDRAVDLARGRVGALVRNPRRARLRAPARALDGEYVRAGAGSPIPTLDDGGRPMSNPEVPPTPPSPTPQPPSPGDPPPGDPQNPVPPIEVSDQAEATAPS